MTFWRHLFVSPAVLGKQQRNTFANILCVCEHASVFAMGWSWRLASRKQKVRYARAKRLRPVAAAERPLLIIAVFYGHITQRNVQDMWVNEHTHTQTLGIVALRQFSVCYFLREFLLILWHVCRIW